MILQKEINEKIFDEYGGFGRSSKRPEWEENQINMFDLNLYKQMNEACISNINKKQKAFIDECMKDTELKKIFNLI